MGYEIFTRKISRVGTPAVSLNTLGRMGLNKAATRVLEREAVEYVLLLWDRENHRIAIRPIKKKDGRAYHLSYGKKGNGSGFSAKTFFDYIGYDYSETRSLPAEWNEGEGIFELEVPVEHLKDEKQRRLLPVEGNRRVVKTG
jgi:hypothetical protein